MKLKKNKYIQVSGDLYENVQGKKIFPDSKTFVDSTPIKKPGLIKKDFQRLRKNKNFSLKDFVLENFVLPEEEEVQLNLPENRSMEEHIEFLWKHLERSANKEKSDNSTLIPLPNSYIIPGGRFREIYYWDTYFTMQGLLVCGRIALAEKILDNFAYLVDKVGHVPNGNRVYFISRSQPPFFSVMVHSVGNYKKDPKWQLKYLDSLEKEYKYWMDGENKKLKPGQAFAKIVAMKDKKYLNRYFDYEEIPREESFLEDLDAAKGLTKNKKQKLYSNIRAACESGWDFSSRWFGDEKSLSDCITTEILPVDLNSLLFFAEKKLSELYLLKKNPVKSDEYLVRSIKRRDMINRVFWNSRKSFYFDYNFKSDSLTNIYSLAACYPLFFEVADIEKAASVADVIEKKFLKSGGLITTLNHTGQQWDAPNGWAPLQYIAIKGLQNYGFNMLANEIKSRWLNLNKDVFGRTKKMFEKYNVESTASSGGGGEYPLQDGFGWTNGVAIALIKEGK